MRQYWWVNHNQTARHEVEGSYLWSPKTESHGGRNEFYNNMRRANPGDLVLSYSNAMIRYVGRVVEFAFTAPKPTEFGKTGAYWSHEGWLLPVYWTKLEPPVRPKAFIDTLGPLLPKKYSPIQLTGDGNQKAYLAQISEEAFEAVVADARFSRAALERGGGNSLTYRVVTERIEDDVERGIREDLELSDTVKDSVVKARRGQGSFRSSVESIERACRLTGITNPALLIASHIKPWRSCSSAAERLDGMNGLMLTPDADHLFDRGFISFKDDGEVLVSPRVDPEDLRRLGFNQIVAHRFGVAEAPAIWRTEGFKAPQQSYLAYHREAVFVDEPEALANS